MGCMEGKLEVPPPFISCQPSFLDPRFNKLSFRALLHASSVLQLFLVQMGALSDSFSSHCFVRLDPPILQGLGVGLLSPEEEYFSL